MSEVETTLKIEIYDITPKNIDEKMSIHFKEVSEYIIRNRLEDIRITTKIKSVTKGIADMTVEIKERKRLR